MNAKNRVQAGEENLVANNVKSGRKIQQKRTEMSLLSRAERISFTIYIYICSVTVTVKVQCCFTSTETIRTVKPVLNLSLIHI